MLEGRDENPPIEFLRSTPEYTETFISYLIVNSGASIGAADRDKIFDEAEKAASSSGGMLSDDAAATIFKSHGFEIDIAAQRLVFEKEYQNIKAFTLDPKKNIDPSIAGLPKRLAEELARKAELEKKKKPN